MRLRVVFVRFVRLPSLLPIVLVVHLLLHQPDKGLHLRHKCFMTNLAREFHARLAVWAALVVVRAVPQQHNGNLDMALATRRMKRRDMLPGNLGEHSNQGGAYSCTQTPRYFGRQGDTLRQQHRAATVAVHPSHRDVPGVYPRPCPATSARWQGGHPVTPRTGGRSCLERSHWGQHHGPTAPQQPRYGLPAPPAPLHDTTATHVRSCLLSRHVSYPRTT